MRDWALLMRKKALPLVMSRMTPINSTDWHRERWDFSQMIKKATFNRTDNKVLSLGCIKVS